MELDISDIDTQMIGNFILENWSKKYMEIVKTQHLEVIPQTYWSKQRFEKNEVL